MPWPATVPPHKIHKRMVSYFLVFLFSLLFSTAVVVGVFNTVFFLAADRQRLPSIDAFLYLKWLHLHDFALGLLFCLPPLPCLSLVLRIKVNSRLSSPPRLPPPVAWVARLKCVRTFPINQARLSFSCCRCLFSFCGCHARNLHALLARSEVTVTTRLQP